jgi:hypothetical protein
LYLFRQGRKSCGRTYQPPFPSSLLFARSRRATTLRLCVGPAVQVFQTLLFSKLIDTGKRIFRY